METIKRGNFEFVKDIFPELYEYLADAESMALIDYKRVGRGLREVIEIYCDRLMRENRMTSIEDDDALVQKLKALKSAGKLLRLPKRYEYLSLEGKRESGTWDVVWRQYGNACSHRKLTNLRGPAVTYENVVTVLQIVFDVFKAEYEKRRGKKAAAEIGVFSEDLMPIGGNYVLSVRVPEEGNATHCIKEYETCSFNDSGRKQKYGIVRVFHKTSMDEKLLALRDEEAFNEAVDEAGIQFDGNVQVDVLSPIHSSGSDYYIIIYKFSRKPVHLNENLVSGIGMQERVKLCKDIASILEKFHYLDTPIYHRNLSYDSIYVCEGKQGELEPSIIKLDCAKIVSEEFGTVKQTVENREKMQRQNKIRKYVAPEVRRLFQGQDTEVDWEKADIYSLGILFGDILRASFAADPASTVKLMKQGVDRKLQDLIDRMRSAKPELRPSMDMVSRQMEEIA